MRVVIESGASPKPGEGCILFGYRYPFIFSRLYCHGQCHQHHQCPEEKHQAWQREIRNSAGHFFFERIQRSRRFRWVTVVFIHVFFCISLLAKGLDIYMYIYIYTRTSLCLNQYIYIHIYIYTHVYIYICI